MQAWLDSGADANSPTDAQGRTPLFVACEKGHVDAAWLLLKKGAEVDRATERGWTPLYLACWIGNVTAARLLLDNGAAVDRAVKDARIPGWTPLMAAKHNGHSSIVALLEEYTRRR